MTSIYKLKDIAFNYDTGFGLADINLEIEKSSIAAIVGPNGSGKTSLLNILAFLVEPSKGMFEYNGSSLEQGKLVQFKKTVAYVQQNPYLLRGTARKNIELGLKLRHVDKETRTKRVDEVMILLDIVSLADRYARSLSGGEAQKVAIAQVLAMDPEVLILDEPFTHLDKNSINELEKLIIRLKNDLNKTVIFTTHDKFQAQWLSDQVYSVIDGKVFKSQLANLFSGSLQADQSHFNTGKQTFNIPAGTKQANHIAIDPKLIVLSKSRFDSSMQNSFIGKISKLVEENGNVRVSVNAGEDFEVIVSHLALTDMGLSIGTDVWISFKSSSILVF